jgi:hypothetical protein
MEIGGLMAYAFAVFLGNPDIMIVLITWSVIVTIALIVIETLNTEI